MPHIDIKCFPRELDEQQKAALAADITDVIIRHLNSSTADSTRIMASYLGRRNCAPNGDADKETWLQHVMLNLP